MVGDGVPVTQGIGVCRDTMLAGLENCEPHRLACLVLWLDVFFVEVFLDGIELEWYEM